ncbi:MAG: ATP-binding protein [Ignavibacteriales bacterium]|nr:ATP-binding protein [Ignavibacteriales bacterium]
MAKKRTLQIRETARQVGDHQRIAYDIECVSSPKEIGRIEQFLRSVNRRANLDDGTFYRLYVSTTEAVNNGITHGNKSDPRKKVCVTCEVNADMLVVRVKDEGEGFDPSSVPNPLDEQNLLKETGRGIFLIKSMMDRVEYFMTEEGTTIEMVINLKRLK